MHALLASLFVPALVLAQESAPARPRRTVAGKLELPADSPKDPVRVWLWDHDYEASSARLLGEVTAADRTFTFADVEWRQPHDWGFGYLLVVARQKDHAVGFRVLRGDHVDPGKADVVLRRQVTLRGTVRDEAGKPVAGATLHVTMFGKPPDYMAVAAPQPPWQTRTDAEGRYALGGLPAATATTLFVRHPAFAQERAEFTDVAAAGDIQLHRGATIIGRVRDAAGQPAVRVRVEAQGIHHSGWAHVLTDETGRYCLQSLEPDSYNVWARAEGLTCAAIAGLAVDGGESAEHQDITLVIGGLIEGVVRDDATGKAVQPGATADVGIYGPSRPQPGAAIECRPIAADGTFRIRAAPGSNHIYLRTGDGWHEVTPGQTVEVEQGKVVKVEFKASRGGREK